MTINPIAFAQEVNRQFLRFQLTAFPLSDPDLAGQARKMLAGMGEESQLVKGPYVSLSRSFAEGASLEVLARQGKIHPMVHRISEYPRMFAHQEAVFDAVTRGRHCLVSTGTGSGKTESFLYPILDHCFRLRDENAAPGIAAIVVYPMNALAADQLDRLRFLLAGTGISFGMYIGATPGDSSELVDVEKMKEGEGRDRIAYYRKKHEGHPDITIAPFEERLTEQEMQESPPRILLTNVHQLEYLMTRGKDLGMFEDAPLRFLVFDEAHTYTGAKGAEVSLLIRRIRAFCNKSSDDVLCIGTSATITDREGGDEAGRRFAHRFFGIDPDNVELVQEIYEEESWPHGRVRPEPVGSDAKELFERTLRAIDGKGNDEEIYDIIRRLSSQVIETSVPWAEGLYDALKSNEVVKVIYDTLGESRYITDATETIWKALGRGNPTKSDEMELLTYLALGAAADRDGSPILRPQLHYFIRGLGGAAAVIGRSASGNTRVKLYFTKQKAGEKNPELLPTAIFPVLTCVTCGQHFFETWLEQVTEETGLTGGEADGDNVFWQRAPDEEGTRILFTDRFVSEMDEYEGLDEYSGKLDKKRETAYICTFCGTIHHGISPYCHHCKRNDTLTPVFVLTEHDEVQNCPSCGHRGRKTGGKVRSAMRPLRAVTVADVHILAQDMINAQSANNRKLIVFTDNRQDAAFQAAWMADHARRYRLRHLMYKFITDSEGPISTGDLLEKMNGYLKENKDLARTLAPEVFSGLVEESYSSSLEKSMKKFLRIFIVREIGTGFSQRESLENWGKMKISYHGITEEDARIKELAGKYDIAPEELVSGIERLLDIYRRARHLYDEQTPIFTQYWHPGCDEIQKGFLPYWKYPPKGLKLQREDGDNNGLVTGLTSGKGQTTSEAFVLKWGIEKEQVPAFLEDIFSSLVSAWGILAPVQLLSSKRKPMAGARGVYQVDSSKLGLVAQEERHQCSVCSRIHTGPSPGGSCSNRFCTGRMNAGIPPEDDYNISLLSKEFTMLMAREHTAQVPAKDRNHIEKEFKRPEGGVNCLVATPTLELGVDIGSLDMVLLRNVPPLPSNYWQRAGRAGRRHRMAVIYTYCRKSVHDEYFFEEPMRILSGRINPPQFNLRNPVMIRKHVHATALSELVRIAQTDNRVGFSEDEQMDVLNTIGNCFPSFISSYLFEEDRRYRPKPQDISQLDTTIERHFPRIRKQVHSVFLENWPENDSGEVSDDILDDYIISMTEGLREQIRLIHNRLMWAIWTRNKLNKKEMEVSRLEDMEQRLLLRCRQYIKELGKRDLENYTLNVLARGGYLPGYATHQGSVTASAGSAYATTWRRLTFELSRPDTIAIREFVPGNLIYANGGKYKTAWYHLPFGEERIDPDTYIIDIESQRIFDQDRTPDGYAEDSIRTVSGVPICDAELAFMSHVSDEEENRFRMPVYMAGTLRSEHRGIDQYSTGTMEFSHMHGQKIRLVNVGPSDQVAQDNLGYPFCIVCGATRSPYASEKEIDNFIEKHKEACGKEPGKFAFSADSQVDGLLFRELESSDEAINLAEGIRASANIQLEMDPEDLQILMLSKSDDSCDVLIYDPMPGGSGLIDQLIENWVSLIESGIDALKNCEGNCEKSCYDCLRTYRNMFFHPQLDRSTAVEMLEKYKYKPRLDITLDPSTTQSPPPEGESTNTAEMRLSALLRDHGFPAFDRQHEIPLPGSIGKTIPDFYYEDESRDIEIAIYLDGLSKGIHGNEERMKIDHYIRTVLRSKGIHVEEIAASALDDPMMLRLHLKALANAFRDDGIKADVESSEM